MGRQDSWAGGSSQFLRVSLGAGGRDRDQTKMRRAGGGGAGGGMRAERLVPSGQSKARRADRRVAGLGCSAEMLGPRFTLPWVHLTWDPPAPGPPALGPPAPKVTCPRVHVPLEFTCPGSTCPWGPLAPGPLAQVHLSWPSWIHREPAPCPTTHAVGNTCQVQPRKQSPCLSPCVLRGVLGVSLPRDPLQGPECKARGPQDPWTRMDEVLWQARWGSRVRAGFGVAPWADPAHKHDCKVM